MRSGPHHALDALIAAEAMRPLPNIIVAAALRLRQRFGPSTAAVIYYGGTLREGYAPGDLLDFYVVVDNLREAAGHWLAALGAAISPPNVYLIDLSLDAGPVKAKVALIGRRRFLRGMRGFSSHLWGRLSQSTAIPYARDEEARTCMIRALAAAAETMISRSVPLMATRFDAEDLWRRALEESYGAELRPESPGRARDLVIHDRDRYAAVTMAALGPPDADGRYTSRPSWACHAAWALRRRWGKLLNFGRLIKAAFTFDGGLDYAVAKIARHSGIAVTVTAADRRRPLRAGWRIFREARRRGGLR
jgi:hypothetical protein